MKPIFIFTVSVVAAGIGYALSNSYEYGLCSYSATCHFLIFSIGTPLLYAVAALSIVSALLLVVPAANATWHRFMIWYAPLAFALLFFYNPGESNLFSISRIVIYQWVAGIFVVLSLLVIAVGAKFGKANDTAPLIRNTFLRVIWVLYVAYLVYSIFIHYY